MNRMLSKAIDFWIKQRQPQKWRNYLRKRLREENELLKIKKMKWREIDE